MFELGHTPTRAVLCCLAFLLSPSSFLPGQEVEWRTDYGDALREAREKGRPLLLDFGTEDCFWCKQLDAITFRDPAVIDLMNRRFIPLKIKAESYPSLVRDLGIDSYPTLVVASPTAKILSLRKGFLQPVPFLEFLRAAEAPATVTAASPAAAPPWMAEDCEKAAAAMARGEYPRAVGLLKKILEEDRKFPVQQKAASLLKDLEDQAAARLKRVRELEAEGKVTDALRADQELVRLYDGTAAAAEGMSLLSSLTARLDNRARDRLKLARELLLQAQEEFRTQQFLSCLLRCETISTRFGDLPEATEAVELAGRIKANPEWMQQVCDGVPELLGMLYLSTAEAKLRQGQPQQAVFFLERIVQAFPNSRHAELAQVRLSQIQGPPPLPAGEEKKSLTP